MSREQTLGPLLPHLMTSSDLLRHSRLRLAKAEAYPPSHEATGDTLLNIHLHLVAWFSAKEGERTYSMLADKSFFVEY